MSVNKKIFMSSTILVLSLSACSNRPVDDHKLIQTDNYYGWQQPSYSYRPMHTNKLLSDYTEQFAMKLIENMRYVTNSTPIAVTSFVDLDNNLKTTSIIGNQLAESFITELQEFGLSVVDFKHTGSIDVTSKGDFSFSRNKKELDKHNHIEYVLSGTLTYNDRGVIVNTRLIGTESKVVVASARGFIPNFVVDSLHSRTRRDGIILNAVD
jgi:TolB-like protein